MKTAYNILRAGGVSRFKEEIASFVTHLKQEFIMQENEQSPDELLNHFQNFITQSAKKIAECKIKNWPNWFSCSEAKLLHHIGIQNEAFKSLYMHYDKPEPTFNAWNNKQKEIGNATTPTNVRPKTSNKTWRPHGTLLSKSWRVAWATSKPIIRKISQRTDKTKLQQSLKKMQISWRNIFKTS